MKPNLFDAVTENGEYIISYLQDGWTREMTIQAKSPGEAMVMVQNQLGSIYPVTFIERSW